MNWRFGLGTDTHNAIIRYLEVDLNLQSEFEGELEWRFWS